MAGLKRMITNAQECLLHQGFPCDAVTKCGTQFVVRFGIVIYAESAQQFPVEVKEKQQCTAVSMPTAFWP
jgi:hypothetical protein